MDSKSKDLLWFIVFVLIIVVFATAHRTFIRKDYFVTTQVPCDSATEQCFKYVPECEDGDPECVPVPEYFKVIKMKARTLYAMCGESVNECDIGCLEHDAECSYIYCGDGGSEVFGSCNTENEDSTGAN